MDIEKQLLKYFLKSTKLTEGTKTLKHLESVYRRLKSSDPFTMEQVRTKAGEYERINKLTRVNAVLGKELMEARHKIVSTLKGIGLPKNKKITVTYEQHGTIAFWYKETNAIFFEKTG